MFLYLLYLFATPALVMLLARKWTWIDKVSPMALLYIIGLLVANLTPWIQQPGLLAANNLIGNICIPLSIPLMLLSSLSPLLVFSFSAATATPVSLPRYVPSP